MGALGRASSLDVVFMARVGFLMRPIVKRAEAAVVI